MRPDPRAKKKEPTAAERLLKLWPLGALLLLLIGLGVWYAFRSTPLSTDDDMRKYVEDRPIMKVMQLYGSFQSATGRQPATMDELKAWAKKLPKDKLDSMGISDIEAATTSPRDNQPYQVVPPVRGMGGMPRVWVYEAVGVNGKRQTAAMGTMNEMTDEQIRAIVPNLK